MHPYLYSWRQYNIHANQCRWKSNTLPRMESIQYVTLGHTVMSFLLSETQTQNKNGQRVRKRLVSDPSICCFKKPQSIPKKHCPFFHLQLCRTQVLFPSLARFIAVQFPTLLILLLLFFTLF